MVHYLVCSMVGALVWFLTGVGVGYLYRDYLSAIIGHMRSHR